VVAIILINRISDFGLIIKKSGYWLRKVSVWLRNSAFKFKRNFFNRVSTVSAESKLPKALIIISKPFKQFLTRRKLNIYSLKYIGKSFIFLLIF